MTDHQWLKENLDAFFADGLDAAERERAQKHLAACADCARIHKETQALETYMTDLFADARPDTRLEDRAIRRLPKVPVARPSWLRFAIAAAAVVVLGVFGTIVQAVVLNSDLGFPGANDRTVASNNLKQLAFWRSDANATFTTVGQKIGGASGGEGKENDIRVLDSSGSIKNDLATPLALITDGVSKTQEFDKEIQYDVDRISDVSVPGSILNATTRIQDDARLKKRIDPSDLYNITTRPAGGDGRVEIGSLGNSKRTPNVGAGAGLETNGTFYGRSDAAKEYAEAQGISSGKVDPSPQGGSQRVHFAPVFVSPEMGWAVPNQGMTKSNQGYFMNSLIPAKPGAPGDPPALSINSPPGSDTPKKESPKDSPPEKNPESEIIAKDKQEQPPVETGRKIIRTGELEFEVESFDKAVDIVPSLIYAVKGGMKLKDDSDK
ncbi:MAG: hypothetical protein EXR98_04740 [Gemmataceae bacterium]|nr:hypothetical protein [Gemmataceae bacterium]